MTFDPGIYPDIPNSEYHAQHDALSSSGARLLVEDGGPELFKHRQDNAEHKDVYDIGTVYHSVLLEDSLDGVLEVTAADWRTKAAQDAKAQAREDGQIPMLTKDLVKVKAMRDATMRHPRARRILEFGAVEQSMFAKVGGINVRSRPDKWTAEHPDYGPLIVDAKSAADVSYDGFQKASGDHGYFQQDPWYRDVLEELTGLKARFMFVACESKPPYRVNVFEHDKYAVDAGRLVNAKAISVFQECTTSGIWPGYREAPPVTLKPWDETRIDQILED